MFKSIDEIRAQFPALSSRPHGQRFAFLDSAASAQKLQIVLDALVSALGSSYANIHRGLYLNSSETTALYESTRRHAARFFGAKEQEIIWTRNSTEAINLVAQTWGRQNLTQNDTIILTAIEHHANIVPWQLLQKQIGFTIRVIPAFSDGSLDLTFFDTLLEGAKLIAITQKSNVTGFQPDLDMIIKKSKNNGLTVLVDGSQGAVHGPQNMALLDADFYALTAHKLYGPTGLGMLWGRSEVLDKMEPYQGGGDMITSVSLPYGTTFSDIPSRFEAGTPAIAEVIAFDSVFSFIESVGWDFIISHEHTMASALSEMLGNLPFVRMHAPDKTGIASFTVQNCHPSDIAMILDEQGVAVRSGHHCAMPLMRTQNLLETGTLRASIGLYTNLADIHQLGDALTRAHRILR